MITLIIVYWAQQATDLDRVGGRGEMLHLWRDQCADQQLRRIAVGTCGRDSIAEHPADKRPEQVGCIEAPSPLVRSQFVQGFLRRDFRDRGFAEFATKKLHKPAHLLECRLGQPLARLLFDQFRSDGCKAFASTEASRRCALGAWLNSDRYLAPDACFLNHGQRGRRPARPRGKRPRLISARRL